REHGADKILFGTDYPVMSVNEELKRFNRLELTEEEREKILSKNVLHLLGDV
ncbi:MAG: amidohydrolase, partial [Clostridiales bacterium]|nr:amidohydrolase [Clostridiales bacterium]